MRECECCGCRTNSTNEVCDECFDAIDDERPDHDLDPISCDPIPLKDEWRCMNTNRGFKWEGDPPEFCPRCGGEWRR